MNTNLIAYDMENFLKKYTRFMTKDIYINSTLYENFLSQYNYLYQELSKNSILFRENIKYKKIINIKENKNILLKLHNQKYLKKAIPKNQSFFDELNYTKILDNNKKAVILSDEEKLIFVNNKNNKELIVGKIKYLINNQKISEEQILIITNNKNNDLEKELQSKNLTKVTYHPLEYYQNSITKDKKIINQKEKNSILYNFITLNLFPQKEKFKELYKNFSKYIYLNKDYEDFDTFKDYHNYIYKKVYLTSNLPLKKYNEKEIDKRRNYLRTINNVTMTTKEEVDIANFLYLNSIDYKYQDKTFIIENNDKLSYISFEKKEDENDNIFLEMKDLFGNNYVEKLIYELIKRRYPLELLSDETIYNKLKDTTINNYFSDFINNQLIKALDYYEEKQTFNNTNLNEEQIKNLIEIYKYYKEYLYKNNLITTNDFKKILEEQLNKYKYIIIEGDININPKSKTLKIVNDYKEKTLFKENIKLLYDYKKYLMENSVSPIKNTYTSLNEIEKLTEEFERICLNQLVTIPENLKKEISIYLYEDTKRLLINKNLSKLCQEITKENKNNIIAVENKKQIDNLILKNSFSKHSPNNLIDSNNNITPYEEFSNLKSTYNNIILPFLISDPYHENLLTNTNPNDIKITIYTILNKCRHKLIILCPKTKKENINKILKSIKKVKFYD